MRADRATFLIMLRRRLRAPLAREHAICQLPKGEGRREEPAATESGRSICGKPLGRHARHACHCPLGPHRLAAHHAVVNALAHTLSRAGGEVQTERYVPELYVPKESGGWQEAVMDVVVAWPLAPSQRLMDVTIRSAHYRGATAQAGEAARHAHTAKQKRYGNSVEALAVEVGGRMLPEALETLRRLAVDSRCGRRWHARTSPKLQAHGLRRLLEWEALRGLAALTLAAVGVNTHALTRRWTGCAPRRRLGEGAAGALLAGLASSVRTVS